MQDHLSKTLILRFSSVGDIVLSTPLIRVLRSRWPHAQIDYLVKAEYADLLHGNPHLSAVVEFPRNGGWRELRAMRALIRRASYDLMIDIHDSLRSRFLCAGHPHVVRVDKRTTARFLLVRMKLNTYGTTDDALPVPLRYLETVRSFGVADDGNGLELFPSRQDAESAGRCLDAAGLPGGTLVIGVCPTSRHATKTWPAARFAEAAAGLHHLTGGGVALFGSGEEIRVCDEVRTALLQAAPGCAIANLAGSLSLRQTAAAMDRCAVVLCNDSGLMHIAAARHRPIVAVFGSTVREFGFFPFRTPNAVLERTLDCRPCTSIGRNSCPKGHLRCLLDTTPADVIGAARTLLST